MLEDMQRLIAEFKLAPRNIRGKNEYQIFKNYVKDISENNIISCIDNLLSDKKLKVKNNAEAAEFRKRGNLYLDEKRLNKAPIMYATILRWYTKSLCYATFNGEEYALALANRSAIYFEMEDYESCIKDIDLCLEAEYPNRLKPKILIRKAKCFKEMGRKADMRKALLQALNVIDDLPESTTEKYRQTISDLITIKVLKTTSDDNDKILDMPKLEENPSFLNASKAIDFQYNTNHGYRVVAKKGIKRGDVLFVEKAFAFASTKTVAIVDPDFMGGKYVRVRVQKSCQYCLSLLTSCIPCKSCVKHLYCNNKCRGAAWKEFHQWECYGVRADLFSLNNHGYLAFRIILKAVFSGSGIPNNSVNGVKEKYGDKDNNYPFVYNLLTNINKIDDDLMKCYVATAVILTRYLKAKTTFFDSMKKHSNYINKNDKELMNIVGSLIIRHSAQLHCNLTPIKIFGIRESSELIENHVNTMIAMTVCPSVAIMKHSCLPNTAHYFVGDTIVVKATEDIKENEEIFRSYSSALETGTNIRLTFGDKEERRQLLKTFFLLNCNCRFCVDPKMDPIALDAYLCINCRGPAIGVADDYYSLLYNMNLKCRCLDCNGTFLLPDNVRLKERIVNASLLRSIKFSYINLKELNGCLEISKTIFVSSHCWIIGMYLQLATFHLHKGNVKEYLQAGKEAIVILKKRHINIEANIAVNMLGLCGMGIESLIKYRPYMSLQNFRASIDIMKELYEAAKKILYFYYPLYIPKVNKKLEFLQTLED